MKLTVIALFIAVAIPFQLSPPRKTIRVAVNKNLELFGLMMQLDMGPDLAASTDSVMIENKKSTWRDWYALAWKNYQRYKAFDGSGVMTLWRQYQGKGIFNDFFIGFLLQVDEAPFAKLNRHTDTAAIMAFSPRGSWAEASKNAGAFLTAFNEFYRSIHFDQYLEQNKAYYTRIVSDVSKNLPAPSFISVMEGFYRKSFAAYYLIPVLNIPTSMGFGKFNKATNTVYNAFGPFSFQTFDPKRLDLGFDYPEKIRALSVHEFGHPFANPAIDKFPEELIKSTQYLYLPIKEEMSKQAYTNWTICLYEHFVRAGEIVIARKMGHPEIAEKGLQDNVTKSHFIYLPFIVQELTAFDKNPDPQKSYDDFAATVLLHLKEANKQPAP